eukprot:GSChrysophyteH1.ASY1.ANO1.649.1 assembled CDS
MQNFSTVRTTREERLIPPSASVHRFLVQRASFTVLLVLLSKLLRYI